MYVFFVCFFFFFFVLFLLVFFFFFFFQAEDGIRDGRVTGVQTCALPICRNEITPPPRRARARRDLVATLDSCRGNAHRLRSQRAARTGSVHRSAGCQARDRKSVV